MRNLICLKKHCLHFIIKSNTYPGKHRQTWGTYFCKCAKLKIILPEKAGGEDNSMSKKIIIPIAIAAAAILIFLTLRLTTDSVPENPPDTTGNTAGNLLNNGLFCEDEGVVYFSNPYDNSYLYSMNPDETNIKRLTNTSVNYINAAGNYLYYYQNDKSNSKPSWGGKGTVGIYRSHKNGKRTTCLKRTVSGVVTLTGNLLYFQNYNNTEGMTLYKSDLKGAQKSQAVNAIIDPSCVQDGFIYYAGIEGDHDLHRINTADDSVSTVVLGGFWMPIVTGDTVYYMNVSDNYSLYRRSLTSGTEEKLTEDRVDTYNITPDYIFYQKNSSDSPALMRMRLDGSEPVEIMKGNYTDLNVTSHYVYFHEFGNDAPIYRVPVDGALNAGRFDAALEAADAEIRKRK